METIIGRVLALVITALATVGVYQVYANARDNQNLNDFQTQMAQIQQAVTSTYQRSSNRYNFGASAISATTAASLNLVPASAVSGTGAAAVITNPYGGTYSIASSSSTTSSFVVTATSVPGNACIQLLQTLSGNGLGLGFTAGSSGAAVGAAPAKTFAAMAVGDIEAACTPASGSTVTVSAFYNG